MIMNIVIIINYVSLYLVASKLLSPCI